MTVEVGPEIDQHPADPKRARLHPISSSDDQQVLVVLDADHPGSSADCIELIVRAGPHARVTRHERARGFIDDPVLAGRDAPASRFVAHWIVRLLTLTRGFGPTDAILMRIPCTSATTAVLDRMIADGVSVLRPRRSLH
jgi:hypothetical protein